VEPVSNEQPIPIDPTPPFPVTPVSPELLAWARQTLDVEAFMAEVEETLATGGVPFDELIAAVEAAACGAA
jgi:hypothetical protein